MRRLVATKDEIYHRLIIHGNLFDPIMQVLKANKGRYNLLDSAILEMFEFIQSEELVNLMDNILNKFGSFLEQIDYVDTFKFMRTKRDIVQEKHKIDIKSDRSSIEK